ncbi:MAG: hypothetical protein COU65_02630 [Candidatus Pacebacteria bacterium CG10_big_fil_rev_8_21_14_0_10_42_12]|nr:hypothetical protein [Candidatus Paceibacterota bacterium]PIR62604.1 MAG: hypothetical protein COU65_02630 [Candidatus Pacebacteria bacterium CG10_big_fil_rev_8_21_14_0_10_42_12]
MIGNILQDPTFLAVLKFLLIIAAGLYSIFAVVVVRQIAVMKDTLLTSFSPVLLTLGFLHLGLAISVLLFFLVSL